MDCADCTRHVQAAIAALPGVAGVEVYLAAEKAVIQMDGGELALPDIRSAVERAGYQAAGQFETGAVETPARAGSRPLSAGWLFAGIVALIIVLVVAGEWMGGLEWLNQRVPWPILLAAIAALGFPVFRNVVRAALNRQVIAHTLMTVGVLAAIAVNEWLTALIVVILMRVGDFVESFTTRQARRALEDLTLLAPQKARVERGSETIEIPVHQVRAGEIVVVRPGERIPVDGVVESGSALVDQSSITGEALPVEVGPGNSVFAATIAQLGSLRVRAEHVGADTTFGKVIRLVEQAEAQRGRAQRLADRFAGVFLPVVAGIALLTWLLRGDPLSVAAVLVVACSCSLTLATPIAVLATVGAAARQGVLFKGGRVIEALARVDTVLIDKTGTLTLGQPVIIAVEPLEPDLSREEVLALAAAVERYSEHPYARAIRRATAEAGVQPALPEEFAAQPGFGVRARVAGDWVQVGGARLLNEMAAMPALRRQAALEAGERLRRNGSTALYLLRGETPAGVLIASDELRPEAPAALDELRALGLGSIELLTGDQPAAAAELAGQLGIAFRAGLLPEDKIRIVKEYQAAGRRVLMIGDGVNDAPALAQADVGMAMAAAGSDIAVEAADLTLLRDDWRLVPQAVVSARRTMRVIRGNIWFTAVYNLVGLTLAAFGILPPILAAAAQSLPDLGILLNSSRLLRHRSDPS